MKKHQRPPNTPIVGGGGSPHLVDEQEEENWSCVTPRNRKHSIKDHRRHTKDKREWTWSEQSNTNI